MKFAKIAFLVGGWYGIIALVPQYFGEKFVGTHFPPAVTHPEYYYGFIGVVVIWHLLFLLIAKDPLRYRPAMLLATTEKFVFGVPTVALYLQGRVVLPIVIAAVVDILFGLIFLEAYRRTTRLSIQSAS
ncbi:MAG TPA: hypothetical protein VF824_13290 [Thermoanaerobaculia bacterium]|jgi:hypothetical protein